MKLIKIWFHDSSKDFGDISIIYLFIDNRISGENFPKNSNISWIYTNFVPQKICKKNNSGSLQPFLIYLEEVGR